MMLLKSSHCLFVTLLFNQGRMKNAILLAMLKLEVVFGLVFISVLLIEFKIIKEQIEQ